MSEKKKRKLSTLAVILELVGIMFLCYAGYLYFAPNSQGKATAFLFSLVLGVPAFLIGFLMNLTYFASRLIGEGLKDAEVQ